MCESPGGRRCANDLDRRTCGQTVRIDHLDVGGTAPPVFIAELSGNHNGSLERALELIDAMSAAGAHGVKFQTYTADTMTLDCAREDFVVSERGSLWAGQTLHKLYETAHTPWEWHKALFERARSRGLVAFSTPFDVTAVDFLEGFDPPVYKIASFENADHALLSHVAATGKPVLMSTGLTTLAELAESVEVLREAGCRELVLLWCTSSYPASPADLNLSTIPHLRAAFGVEVGFSDHTLGIGAAVAAVVYGASVIEKHVTLRRSDGGVDSAFSLEPEEVSSLVRETTAAKAAIGMVQFDPTDAELASRRFRRSLYVVEDVRRGEQLTSGNVRSIRPGFGLPPKYLALVLGRSAAQDIERGTPLRWELLS